MNDEKKNFPKLIPVVVQDIKSKEVLMLGYANREAVKRTLDTGRAWYFSRSRGRLWQKGETSGNTQYVKDVRYDCDSDALLYIVEQVGPACHTGNNSCFYRRLSGPDDLVFENNLSFLNKLETVIAKRKANMPEGSYVGRLFSGGEDRVLKKVPEEAGEVLLAAKNRDRKELVYEMADLLFHSLLVLSYYGVSLAEVVRELADRHDFR